MSDKPSAAWYLAPIFLGIILVMSASLAINHPSFGYGGGGGGGGGWGTMDPRVCGDKLCSEIPGGRDAFEAGTVPAEEEEEKSNPLPQEKSKLPEWIKNTAGWWSEGQIEDSDFIQSMEFLIKEEIIQVPVTSVTEEKSDTVPDWVKNNAGWWADGMISDNDFVNGIQFMIKNGIITIQDFSKKMEMDSSEIAKEMSDETEEMIMDEAAKESSSVSEKMAMEDKGPKITHMGEFRGLAGHHGEGNAKIFSANGESFLRFERFTVTNGPDLFVYIAQDGDVHNGILLQRLKGSTGDQNYILPEDIDIEVYNTAVVYCKLFGVYFAEAKLSVIQGY